MRTVGQRREAPISQAASSERLLEGARFNDEIHGLLTGDVTAIPKGVYYFKTHQEANRHQLDCVVQGMVNAARGRS